MVVCLRFSPSLFVPVRLSHTTEALIPLNKESYISINTEALIPLNKESYISINKCSGFFLHHGYKTLSKMPTHPPLLSYLASNLLVRCLLANCLLFTVSVLALH